MQRLLCVRYSARFWGQALKPRFNKLKKKKLNYCENKISNVSSLVRETLSKFAGTCKVPEIFCNFIFSEGQAMSII